MMRIDADGKYFRQLNEEVRAADDTEITIDRCNGQRYIGAGMSGKSLLIHGVPSWWKAPAATRRAMPCAAGRFL